MGVGLAARRHGARFALALLVAVVAYAAFPRSATVRPAPLAVGSVSSVDVIAPVGFLVLKSGEVRAREAEAVATTVKPLITARPEASDSALAAAGRFFAALDSALAEGASLQEAVGAAGAALERGDLPALASPGLRAALRRAVLAALRLSETGYLAPGISTAELGREVVLRRAGDERVVSSDSLHPFGDFLEAAAQQRPERRGAVAEHLYERLLSTFFRPTLVYERGETERRRDLLRRTVDSVEAVVQPGEKIIGAHEVVDRAASAKLVAYRAALERGGAGRVRGAFAVLGVVGLETLLCLLFGVICYFFRPQLYQSGRALGFFALGFAVVLVAAGLIARWAPARSELIPVALAAILFSVLFDGRIAAVAAMVLAALIGVQPAFGGSEALFLTFVGGAAAALSVQRIRRRTQTYYSIAIVTAVYTIAAVVSGAAAAEPAADIGRSAALGGINALVSAALAMLVLPLAERFTRSTTDLTLLELSGPDRPLLRRLATEAPGTYAHSVAMANLCEAACNAIGANGLLARVGCYYHDIGKLNHPLLFAENQTHGKNPHDQLRPSASAALIRRHVEDGLQLAAEHRLPEVLRAFIPEHHGTSPIAFFLEQAREAEPAALARGELFRYGGPLPRSAETAVALLGDGVEAALRVLDDPTPETIAGAIDHLIQNRVESGQLREAPLTLAQIEVVKREFVRAYTAMYHNRVEYPEDAGGITADWESAHHG
jgi:hypothetical protein